MWGTTKSIKLLYLKQKLLLVWFFLTDPRYRAIEKSSLFDSDYYLMTNPDLTQWNRIPLVHYLRRGWHEGRKPHPLFDPLFYLHTYAEVAESNMEPLNHYIMYGAREGRDPHPLFATSYYLEQNPDVLEAGINPLVHYIETGAREGRDPHPLFATSYYLEQNPDVLEAGINPLVHYLRKGWHEGHKPHPYFDPSYYRHIYPDVAQSGMYPHNHYLTIGVREERRPSPFFDVAWYLDRTPILRTLSLEPVEHYMKFGAVEGKSPLPLFDPLYYREHNSDVEDVDDLFLHYLTVGLAEERHPSRWFDPGFYRSAYPDTVGTGLSPLEHYLQKGIHEQRYPEARVQDLPLKPLISIVVPVYNMEEHYLNNCIRSVLYQAYPHWELCLADDCSSHPHVRPVLEKWAKRDKRIKVTFLKKNYGISRATNAAATLATGQYIAFLDNDDELTVDCLYQVIKVIGETGADLLYTDEDLIGADGRRLSVFYKPGFNWELLLSHNYITHFVVTTKLLFDAVDGFSPAYDGAQDYDLVLKLSEQARRVVHIPQVLYHWRALETSTSINHGKKTYSDEAGRNALITAMERRGVEAEVRSADWKFYYRVQRKLRIRPFVSILVHWNDDPAGAFAWLSFLLASTSYDRFEIILMMSAAADMEGAYCQAVTGIGDNIFCFHVEKIENIATSYNLAARQSRGEYLIFLDCGVTIRSADWLELLLAQAQEKGTGAVAYGVNDIQAGGEEIETVPDINDHSPWYYFNFVQKCSIHMNGLQWSQNVLAVSWELCMVSKELFDACNGFDDRHLSSLFWSLDFCLRLREHGYENVYVSLEIAERKEKKKMTDRSEKKKWGQERRVFQERWRKRLLEGDVYYNLGVLDNKQVSVDDFLKWYAGV